jgi:hypothetical protein
MAIDLAITLAAIAARAVVAQLVRGDDLGRDGWAGVAGDVAGALVTSSGRWDRGPQPGLPVLSRKLDDVPAREFDEHMAAGRRHARDLADEWRTDRDRLGMIRDARHEFVRAFGIAEHMSDPYRQAVAEVAIAGCWLWVPSLPDVRKALDAAQTALCHPSTLGRPGIAAARAEVVRLGQLLTERPAPPAVTATRVDRPTTRLAYGRWVDAEGIELRLRLLDREEPEEITTSSGLVIPNSAFESGFPVRKLAGRAGELVPLDVHNGTAEWISVAISFDAVVVRRPLNNTLPAENRVAPGNDEVITLTRPAPRTAVPAAGNAVLFPLP